MSDSQAFYEFMHLTARYTGGNMSLPDALSLWSDACFIFNGANLRVESEQSNLDKIARTSPVIHAAMIEGRRIIAVKELRAITKCGLKEAKDSIDRVYPL